MLENIPGKLFIYVIKKDCEDKVYKYLLDKADNSISYSYSNSGKFLYPIYPTPGIKSRNGKFINPKSIFGIPSEYMELVSIDNKELELNLCLTRVGYRGSNLFCLEINHRKLNSSKFQPYLEIRCFDFLKCVRDYNIDIVNFKLSGKYRISIYSCSYYCSRYSIVSNDYMNYIIDYSIKFGEKRCLKERYTSKWIPGHIYCLSNLTPFIYLGEGRDIPYVKESYYLFSNCIRSLFSMGTASKFWIDRSDKTKIIDAKIVIPLITIEQSSSISMLRGKKVTIDEIINTISITNNRLFDSSSYYTGFGFFYNKKPILAMDLGEFFKLDKISDNIFTEIYKKISTFINIKAKSNYNYFTSLDDIIRPLSKEDSYNIILSNEKLKEELIKYFIESNRYYLIFIKNKLLPQYQNGEDICKYLIDDIDLTKTVNKSTSYGEDSIRKYLKRFLETSKDLNIEERDLYKYINEL